MIASRIRRPVLAVLAAALGAAGAFQGNVIQAVAVNPQVTINVNNATDGANSNSSNSCVSGTLGCTLRAAVQYADKLASATTPSDVTIKLPAGDYRLTISTVGGGLLNDNASNGDLHIGAKDLARGRISIAGAGMGTTFITQTVAERAIKVDANSIVNISGVTVRGGVAGGPTTSDTQNDGGGIQVCGGAVFNLSKSTVSGNAAQDTIDTSGQLPQVIAPGLGGGISIRGINGCHSTFGGEPSSSDPAQVTVADSIISGNSADEDGGGIYNQGFLDLRDSALVNNHATGNLLGANTDPEGGGLWSATEGTLHNVTITGNTVAAVGSGGAGVYVAGAAKASGSSLNLFSVTMAKNTAGAGAGGGLRIGGNRNADVDVFYSIIAGNTGGNCKFDTGETLVGNDGDSANQSQAFNIDSENSCGFTTLAQVNTDPKLAAVAVTHGITPTMVPLVGSPAVDAVTDSTVCPAATSVNDPEPPADQRHIDRPQGARCDIGAVEVIPTAVTSVAPACGPAAGGTTVTVTGTGFTFARGVDFGTTAATSFTINSDTSITAVTPGGAGTVPITVRGLDRDGSSATDAFKYDCTVAVTHLPDTAAAQPAALAGIGLLPAGLGLGAAAVAVERRRRRRGSAARR
jgi:hypothetical protein